MNRPHIVVAGAGSIGCYVGGLLAHSGRNVSFLGRKRLLSQVASHGLHLTDLEGLRLNLRLPREKLTEDPAVLASADMILVTVKSGATREMGGLIARFAPATSPVVSLQNGVSNARSLREVLPGRMVLAGMVPFNVVSLGEGRFHRGTSGALIIESVRPDIAQALRTPQLEVEETSNIEAVQWGKLLLNLNNALNALSGITLHEQLLDPKWRRLLARQQEEALHLLHVAAIRPWSMGPLPAKALPSVLRLPTPLFRLLARSSVKIDRQARSSMWEDLERGRPTEIDQLQGEVMALADRLGREAPFSARVSDLVKQAEKAAEGSPRLRPEQITG